jgi:hypothetical protein
MTLEVVMLALVMVALFLLLPAYVIGRFVRAANPTLPTRVVSGAPVAVPFRTGEVLAGAYLSAEPQFATPAPVVEALVEARPFDHAGGPVYVHPSLTRMFAQMDEIAANAATQARVVIDEGEAQRAEIKRVHDAKRAAIKPAPHKTATRKAQQDTRERVAAQRKLRNKALAQVMRSLDVPVTDVTWPVWNAIARSLTWDASDDVATNAELFAHAVTELWAKHGSGYVRVHVYGGPDDATHADDLDEDALVQAEITRQDEAAAHEAALREAALEASLTTRGTVRRPVCKGHAQRHWSDEPRACTRLARNGSQFCCDKHAERYARGQ